MLVEVLQYLRNWFRRSIAYGTVIIKDGRIESIGGESTDGLFQVGQYIRILGSVLNDGIYQLNTCELIDETFEGAVWGLAIPRAVLDLVAEIEAWQTKNGDTAASPFTSESFGGYSYSKGGGGTEGDTSWRTAFASRLNPWRKI